VPVPAPERPLVAEDFGELPFDRETDKAIELPFA
jgi:hypothetical protein